MSNYDGNTATPANNEDDIPAAGTSSSACNDVLPLPSLPREEDMKSIPVLPPPALQVPPPHLSSSPFSALQVVSPHKHEHGGGAKHDEVLITPTTTLKYELNTPPSTTGIPGHMTFAPMLQQNQQHLLPPHASIGGNIERTAIAGMPVAATTPLPLPQPQALLMPSSSSIIANSVTVAPGTTVTGPIAALATSPMSTAAIYGISSIHPLNVDSVAHMNDSYTASIPASASASTSVANISSNINNNNNNTKPILKQDQWNQMLSRLCEFKKKHGHTLVPKRYKDDPKLGCWTETQRVQFRKLWKKTGRSDEELLNVKDSSNENDDVSSGGRDGDQHENKKAMDVTLLVEPSVRLNRERLSKLQEVGFVWLLRRSGSNNARSTDGGENGQLYDTTATDNMTTISSPENKESTKSMKRKATSKNEKSSSKQKKDAEWSEMYERLQLYKANYGDCLVPKGFKDDPKLSTWVELQRRYYNNSSTKASAAPVRQNDFQLSDTAASSELPPIKAGSEGLVSAAASAGAVVLQEINTATTLQSDLEEENKNGSAMVQNTPTHASTLQSHSETTNDTDNNKSHQPLLTQERIAKLDELGFVWSLRSKKADDYWNEMYKQLLGYKAAYGDCLVPNRFVHNQKLGKWCETQRSEFKKLSNDSASSKLTPWRVEMLNKVDFQWSGKNKMKRNYEKEWNDMYEALLRYKNENGDCLVPENYSLNRALGSWVQTQRLQHQNFVDSQATGNKESNDQKEGLFLTLKRKQRLDSIGFCWSNTPLVKVENLNEVQMKMPASLDVTGSMDMGMDMDESIEVSTQTSEEKRALAYGSQWDYMFDRLVEYKEKKGNTLVPKRYKTDKQLGTWVDTQRVQYKKRQRNVIEPADLLVGGSCMKKSRLTDERIARLESLGFVWSVRDDWKTHFDELIKYKEIYGNCDVPARYEKNKRLGIWVTRQRQQYKQLHRKITQKRRNPLTPERIQLLDSIGFSWKLRSRETLHEFWENKYNQLKEFYDEHGHCRIPFDTEHSPLFYWCDTQRTQYSLFLKAKNENSDTSEGCAITEDQIVKLQNLGFDFSINTQEIWVKQMEQLRSFKNTYGRHCPVPDYYSENPSLSIFANTQRTQMALYKQGKMSTLDEEKIKELNSVGFCWNNAGLQSHMFESNTPTEETKNVHPEQAVMGDGVTYEAHSHSLSQEHTHTQVHSQSHSQPLIHSPSQVHNQAHSQVHLQPHIQPHHHSPGLVLSHDSGGVGVAQTTNYDLLYDENVDMTVISSDTNTPMPLIPTGGTIDPNTGAATSYDAITMAADIAAASILGNTYHDQEGSCSFNKPGDEEIHYGNPNESNIDSNETGSNGDAEDLIFAI